ncbi:Chromosome partition protein Smc [Streptomyces sp. RB5]|uniref:Chromosome partition protein Smc n=1 Tax=Streptomyces smaragdinus TaxID=2585196 RepID=A0A7K0CNA9_9ACTN|nr:hypothetical protein [Streptomyces smaragdinus]MQY14939.1 Chromosome partition protein Smc [Streptomyces smaragdinus]
MAGNDGDPGGPARQELQALAAGGGIAAALPALGASLRWATAALAAARDDTGHAALEGFYGLFDALEELPDLVAEVPRLLAAARPGPRPAQELTRLTAELGALGERMDRDRADLVRLTAAEEELSRRLADHGELRERVDELRGLERLADALDALAGQRQVIDERLRVLRSGDTSALRDLDDAGAELVRLTRDRLEALPPRISDTLRQAEETGARLADAERELARATAELETLRRRLESVAAELGDRVPALGRHARADRELAEALAALHDAPDPGAPVLEQARGAVREVERRLGEIDGVLRDVLADRDRAAARPVR